MYRASFYRPRAVEPYLTVHTTEGHVPAPGQTVALGGQLETVRGDWCGAATLKLSAPPADEQDGSLAQPLDRVRIWLPGDADDDPTYTGEMVNEPWLEGPGEVQLRSLAERAGKAAWHGEQTPLAFKPYLQHALSLAVLLPGLLIGDIPENPATLKARTSFELIGDTFQAAMPVIEGGTWGVNGRGELGVYAPTSTITHRFVRGQTETPPGTMEGYANCIQLPYTLPDGTQAQFEARVEPEVQEHGETWEVTQMPTQVQTTDLPVTSADHPTFGVTVTAPVGALPFPRDGAANSVQFSNVAPLLDPAWAGHISDVFAGLNLGLGVGFDHRIPLPPVPAGDYQLADYSVHVLKPVFPADSLTPDLTMYIRAEPGVPVRIRGPLNGTTPPEGYITATCTDDVPVLGASWHVLDRLSVGYDLAAAHAFQTANGFPPRGISVAVAGLNSFNQIHPSVTPENTPFIILGSAVPLGAPTQRVEGYVYQPHVLEDGRGLPPLQHPEHRWAEPVGGLALQAQVQITLPQSLQELQRGTTLLVPEAVTKVQSDFGGVFTDWVQGSDREDAPGLKVWSPSKDVRATSLVLQGPLAQIGRLRLILVDTSDILAYAYGLLRYRTQPVRKWTGTYNGLRRVPCHGVARFEFRGEEVDLDVQRVTYDLTTLKTKVEAGTPQANGSVAAIREAFLGLRRDIRLGGASDG